MSRIPTGQLPYFIGLGAQKAGTTSLYGWLQNHPRVFMPPQKEVQFFTLNYQAGTLWYRQHFQQAMSYQRCGEITPYYLFHPLAPQRIQQLLPRARLIILLRDPVERTLSQLFHSIRLGLEPLDPLAALEAEESRLDGAHERLQTGVAHPGHQHHAYVLRSRYEQQLARYEALFGQEQLLLLRSEDMYSNPAVVWKRLMAFLQLQPLNQIPPLPHLNRGGPEVQQIAATLRGRLRKALEATYQIMAQRYGMVWP
jgi:hypothetical protein